MCTGLYCNFPLLYLSPGRDQNVENIHEYFLMLKFSFFPELVSLIRFPSGAKKHFKFLGLRLYKLG